MARKIAISGASGFIGKKAEHVFRENGDIILTISRDILKNKEKLQAIINEADIVINLAGSPIITRWTKKNKKEIYDSRIKTTRTIVEAMNQSPSPPKLLISASAIGLYDDENEHEEESKAIKNDFLSEVVISWEAEAENAENHNTRVVILRFGIILGRSGGIVRKLKPLISIGLGTIMGSGEQHFSFVHIIDVIRIINFVIKNEFCKGVYNVVAPETVNHSSFVREMGRMVHKPVFLRMPEWLIKTMFKNGGGVLTNGQNVKPAKLLKEGFIFKYPTITECLTEILKTSRENRRS